MSPSLGEKLRLAREERGFTLSEVAEQTRISSLYLESIENDDYRILPGGIFNKGFVKSYAKFVGVNEQEALLDYSRLLAESETATPEGELKLYRPEVLTDDRSSASMAPTIIFAVVILALMTGGVLFLVDYLRRPATEPTTNAATNTPANTATEVPANTGTVPSDIPQMASIRVEFKAISQPVPIVAISDGTRTSHQVTPASPATLDPKESLTVNYNKWNADKLQMTINGKTIALPGSPLTPSDKRIEFTINQDNLAQIWTTGAISTDVPPAATETNIAVSSANLPANQPATPVQTPVRPTPVPKPTVAANTAAPKPTPETKPANTAKPAANKP